MFTGASNAHVAILLVDARAGVLRQTRRHARIAKLLGVKHFVATVNKIDLVDFDPVPVRRSRNRAAADGGPARCRRPDGDPDRRQARRQRRALRRSAPRGTTGPTLLRVPGERRTFGARSPRPAKLRLPVQWVSRPTAEQRRRYTGRLAAGTLRVGDAVVSLPAGTRSTVTAVDTLDDDREIAVAPLSVSIELADDIDVGRGDVFVSAGDDAVLPVLARELDATVCWFADTPAAGRRPGRAQAGHPHGPGHRAGAALPAGPRDAGRARRPGRVGAQRHRHR